MAAVGTKQPIWDVRERNSATIMTVALLYMQFGIGWDELDHYPEQTTWRGLFVFVTIGYIPVVAMAGVFCMLEITKLIY